jgi:HPt (histidine-containing phosphotransfer) domain-containing protein
MHKLRGSAGMLGAKEIQQLAATAEAACLEGDRDLASHLARQLLVRVQRLSQCALTAMTATSATSGRDAPKNGEAIEPEVMAAFVALLRQQSLSALSSFDALSPRLRGLLSDDRYALLRGLVDDLKFNEAAQALEDSPH